MRIFWKKCKKIVSATGDPSPNPHFPPTTRGFAPRPPCCYFHLLLQLCWDVLYR